MKYKTSVELIDFYMHQTSCLFSFFADRLTEMCGTSQQEPVAGRLWKGLCLWFDSEYLWLFSRLSFFLYMPKSCFGLLCLKCSTLILPKALTEYKSELRDDPIISTHLTKLYDNLLEQNLIRVIEPFSRVQVIAQMLYIHRKRTLQFLGGQSL